MEVRQAINEDVVEVYKVISRGSAVFLGWAFPVIVFRKNDLFERFNAFFVAKDKNRVVFVLFDNSFKGIRYCFVDEGKYIYN